VVDDSDGYLFVAPFAPVETVNVEMSSSAILSLAVEK